MKKCVFSQILFASIAIFAMMTLQSCQSCQRKPADPCNPPPAQPDCKEEKSCAEDEASEEAMTHVIEIDQPETPSVSEEKTALQPAAETPMEATSTPMQNSPEKPAVESISSSPVEQAAEMPETASTPAPELPSLETLNSVSVSNAMETAVIDILAPDSSNQE
jgi:hypothetical protein